MKPTIALDAMGGDFAPANPIAGALMAARELGSRVVLVGRQDEIDRELKRHSNVPDSISVVHASETVSMDESPAAALRRKKDSSLRVAANLVREGKADAVVSNDFGLRRSPPIARRLEADPRVSLCSV